MSVILSAAASLSWIAGILGRGGDEAALLAAVASWSDAPGRRDHAPLFLPYLSGERTPHNDPAASGMFAGLRAEHDARALTYSVLEGVAFALADGMDVLRDAGAEVSRCFLVGGGARDAFWAQLIRDVDARGVPLLGPCCALCQRLHAV